MLKLLTIKHEMFKKEMDAAYASADTLSFMDIFDVYIHTLKESTNVLKEEDLKLLVFKQFREYCNFDKTINQVAQSVSDIQETTKNAITAMDNNDKSSLKGAYDKLKEYQKRIEELEDDIYTDDITGLYNRKYLVNKQLEANELLRFDGVLAHININNFASINKEHGYEAGDAVIKFISKMLQKRLEPLGLHLVRYIGVQFVVLCKKDVSAKVNAIFKDTVDSILSKKFKTHEGEILHIELKYDSHPFSKNDDFKEVYSAIE